MAKRRPTFVQFWFRMFEYARKRGMCVADAREWAGAASRVRRVNIR